LKVPSKSGRLKSFIGLVDKYVGIGKLIWNNETICKGKTPSWQDSEVGTMIRKAVLNTLICSAILFFYAQQSLPTSRPELQALMDKYGKESLIEGIMRLRACRITLLVNGDFREFAGTPAPEFVTVETLQRDLEKAGSDVEHLEEIVKQTGRSPNTQASQSDQEAKTPGLVRNQREMESTKPAQADKAIKKKAPVSRQKGDRHLSDNAAIHYSRAFELLDYPGSSEFKRTVRTIIKEGWIEDYIGMAEVLKENEPSFREFEKGLALDHCDFDFGQEYTYLVEKTFPTDSLRQLSELVLLKGRYYEKQKDFEKAINAYLSTLTLARHVAQDSTTASRMVSLDIERKTYAPLRGYLGKKEIDKKTCQKILTYLEAYDKHHFPVKEIFEAEKAQFMSMVDMAIDDVRQKVTEGSDNPPVVGVFAEEFAEVFRQETLKLVHDMTDEVFENFIRATKTNDKKDWERAITELARFKKAQRRASTKIDVSKLSSDDFTENMRTFSRELAKMNLVPYLGIPNFKKHVDIHYAVSKELRVLKSLAKTRLSEA